MEFQDFKSALESAEPPPGIGAPLRAMWRDARGDWDGAHREVQDESTREAAWVHAYLHRKEGDLGNAGYWYSRAGRKPSAASLENEWEEIVRALLET